MIHAYNKLYLDIVMHNLAALFDLAINIENIDSDIFADMFSKSIIARGIEEKIPDILAGKSATEMLMIILNKNVENTEISSNRTPQYWAGWILAYAQWYLNESFKDILNVMPFSTLISLYYPYHEANEMKVIEIIQKLFPKTSSLKEMRRKRKLTQEQLSLLSGVNIRSIKSYEQKENDILKAQIETILMLAEALDCSIEELIK